MKDLCTTLAIKQLRMSPYHPQSDGMLERWHDSQERLRLATALLLVHILSYTTHHQWVLALRTNVREKCSWTLGSFKEWLEGRRCREENST